MRLVYLGSGEFGLPTLERLAHCHDIVAVVSQPDRPAGRGGKCRATPISDLAEKLGLPLLRPESPNTEEFARELAGLKPDLAVIVAYGHLIGKALLAIPRLGFVNLHASLLPAYRGAAPVPWAILGGEKVSGATVFALNEKFDCGAIIGRVELPIDDSDTSGGYLAKLSEPGAALMVESVAALAEGRAVPQAQDHALASRAPKLKKDDGAIDWSAGLAEIDRKVRAFQPWPHAFASFATCKGMIKVNILKIGRAETGAEQGVTPGTVLSADAKHGLAVMTGDGPARLLEIQPEGKRPMSDIEYLRGRKIFR